MNIFLCNILAIVIIFVYEYSSNMMEWFRGGAIIFDILNIIACSFIASSVFYYVQSYIPEKKKREKSFDIMESILLLILKRTELYIFWFTERIKINQDGTIKLCPGDYFPKSEFFHKVKREFVIYDLEITANRLFELLLSLFRTSVLINLEMDFTVNINTLLRLFENGSSFRNTLVGIGNPGFTSQTLKKDIEKLKRAHEFLLNYYQSHKK